MDFNIAASILAQDNAFLMITRQKLNGIFQGFCPTEVHAFVGDQEAAHAGMVLAQTVAKDGVLLGKAPAALDDTDPA